MKVELRITKSGTPIYTGTHDISDSDSFGKACADAWATMCQHRMSKEASIGALFEHINDDMLDQLNGAQISLRKLP